MTGPLSLSRVYLKPVVGKVPVGACRDSSCKISQSCWVVQQLAVEHDFDRVGLQLRQIHIEVVTWTRGSEEKLEK